MAKILLVDDAAFMRMMLKNTLSQAGYTDLYEAEDGVKAEEVYQAEKPDLVFMDITMPNQDGLENSEKDQSNLIQMQQLLCVLLWGRRAWLWNQSSLVQKTLL